MNLDNIKSVAVVVSAGSSKAGTEIEQIFVDFPRSPDGDTIRDLMKLKDFPGISCHQANQTRFSIVVHPGINHYSVAEEIARCLIEDHGLTVIRRLMLVGLPSSKPVETFTGAEDGIT